MSRRPSRAVQIARRRSALLRTRGGSMIKTAIERLLIASRWLLTPLYIALAIALLEMLARAAVSLYSAVIDFWTLSDEGVLLSVLSIVDMTLTASLVVIVVISGYTNFVSPVTMREA